MPHPRFYKLAEAKRLQILEVAAQEFAAAGFADASLNRILERAAMSKGAAYYYFEDKADLFVTVIGYCSEQLHLIAEEVDPAQLDAATFWPTFAELHRQPLLRSYAQPWLFGALKAAGRLPRELRERGPLAAFAARLTAYTLNLLHHGQSLGIIRTDLADELLFAWIEGLDSASDDWLLSHWKELDLAAIAHISDMTVEAMRRAIAPTG